MKQEEKSTDKCKASTKFSDVGYSVLKGYRARRLRELEKRAYGLLRGLTLRALTFV